MHPHSIALIAAAGSDEADSLWWNAIFHAWPVSGQAPRIEFFTPERLLSDAHARLSLKSFDAALILPATGADQIAGYHVLDLLEQTSTPAVLMIDGPLSRMESFHPGAVIPQPRTAEPMALAGMLYALAQRQGAVRSLEQNLHMAHSFQGETAAEIDRLHQELLLAARVQRDFLPKHMPVIDGLDCAVLFRPAGFVSGDTYDVCRLDDSHVGFFLADAMGHGVPAALMTLYISGSLPRRELQGGTYRLVPPAEALRRLNNELHQSIAGPARFATAVCGTIDLRTREITLACAGHPPPLRITPHGVRPVDVSGMLLGVVDDFDYQQTTIRLEEDEILVVHSDGIETSFAPRRLAEDGDPFSQAYLTHLAGMRRGQSLQSLLAAMENLGIDIDSQAGSFHQDDDLTILAFQSTHAQETRHARSAAAVVGAE